MGKFSAQRERVLDTNVASRDVVSLKIFILGEPIGAFVPLTMIKHHALPQ
jgi:hypothetical protein